MVWVPPTRTAKHVVASKEPHQVNDKTLILFQGIPGSGKSTFAKTLQAALFAVYYSSDDHWYDNDGVYVYDPSRAGEVHRGKHERRRRPDHHRQHQHHTRGG